MRGLYSNLLDRGDGPSMRENLSQRPRGDFIVELLERGTKADLRELLYAIRPDPFGQVADNALWAAALCIERDNEDGFPWAARRARDSEHRRGYPTAGADDLTPA